MKSFFGTDRLKRSRILKAILFIIIMISAVSSMSLLYKSVYAQEENQHKYAAKKRVLFISSYSYAWETVPEQIAGIKEVLNEDVVIDYKFMDSKNIGISLNNVSLLSTAKLNAASSPTIIASYGSTSPR